MAAQNLVNTRTLKDVNLQVLEPLPAAGATAYSPTLDLSMNTAYRVPSVELQVFVPALPNLAATTNINFVIQDSADGVTFANVSGYPNPALTVTGVAGGGAAAVSQNFKLPLGLRRYLRVEIIADASSGANTAVTATLGLVF